VNSAAIRSFPVARRQTYAFLEDARRTCHVYLMADVDASRLNAARAARPGALSFVSFVVKAAADVIAGYPDARAVLEDGLRPRLVGSDDVHAKVLFDKTVGGQRCVLSGTVRCAQQRSLDEIQQVIDDHKLASVDASGPFKNVRMLQQLPLPLARLVYRAALSNPLRRLGLQGTFSVTSVGHEPVRAIFPMIAGTLGFGVGRVADAPVVRDGALQIAPTFTLSLAFDHRVLDGAMASEVLGLVKQRLETWGVS
jgi:pyruvate/2-oxoglutarate dehydrogenase complex dihydrolipoamide acyltransferase (E2) component